MAEDQPLSKIPSKPPIPVKRIVGQYSSRDQGSPNAPFLQQFFVRSFHQGFQIDDYGGRIAQLLAGKRGRHWSVACISQSVAMKIRQTNPAKMGALWVDWLM
jgi:hypothetical protein